jgi:glycosyltransferase involved in cell wall biosynthesis
MKKLLFAAYNLDLGGIETSLVTLTNFLLEKGYEITIALEKKEGVFLDKISPNVKIIEYTPANDKNIIKRKINNLIKRYKFIRKYKNKFDFAASFATYSLPASFMARTCSKNNAIWGHADYLSLYNNDKKQMKTFFDKRKIKKFKKIIFVSQEGKDSFIEVYPKLKDRVITCNNLVNDKRILNQAEEPVKDLKKENVVTFLNVGRHDERQKKLTRIIYAAEQLKKDNKKFRIIFIGDGPDTNLYKEEVKNKKLEHEIVFLGRKKNPYPYYKLCDCVVLSSDYEGYPVVYLESFILNKPIITTNVSDSEQIEGQGIVVEKDEAEIYKAMKDFIENGYQITKQFDAKDYNNNIFNKLQEIIG